MTNAFRINRIVLLWLTFALGLLAGQGLPARADCKPTAKHDCCAAAKAACHCLNTPATANSGSGHLSCACQTAPDEGGIPASVEKAFAFDTPVLLAVPLLYAASPDVRNLLFIAPATLARPPNLDTSAPPRAPPFPA